MTQMSHTDHLDTSTVEPSTGTDVEGTPDMGETAEPIVARHTAGDLPTREKAERSKRRSELITYGVTIVAVVFAVQGMVSFGMDVLAFPLWFALFVSGFLELAMLAFASWDQTDALRGRRPKALETWIAAVASGVLSSLHMFAHRTDVGDVVWAFGPFEVLGGLLRLLPPITAAFLLHKIVRSDLLESEGRTDREVKIAKRMHAVARASKKLQRLRRRYPDLAFIERWLIARAEAAHDRAFDRAVKVLPATDPRFNVEMQTWARGLAVADILPGLTDAQLDDGAMHVNQVVKATVTARRPAKRPVARPAPAAPRTTAAEHTTTGTTSTQPATSAPAPVPAAQAAPPADTITRPRTGSTPRVDPEKAARQARLRELFDREVAANPGVKPDASRLHDEAGLGNNPVKATSRKWVQAWWNEVVETAIRDDFQGADADRDQAQIDQEAARPAPDLKAVRAVG